MKAMAFISRVSARLLDLHARGHAALSRRVDERTPITATAPYILRPYSSASTTKIFHVNGNFGIGGTTQLIVDLVERLSDEFTHEIIVPCAPDPLPYQPVRIHACPVTDMTPIRALLAKERPALVHVHYWVREGDEYVGTALWYAAIFTMCAELDIPVLQNVNVPTHPRNSPAVVHNVYVSRYVLDGYDPGDLPSSVIYPGSDFSHFARSSDEALADDVIGMVYRLDPDKLEPRSIEPFIAVARRRPATRCLIIGGGYYLDQYRQRVTDEGLSEQFEFTGFVSYEDLPNQYRRLSVFVTPVHNESFGQVTPFAMSMGLAVAGFHIGALPEILDNDRLLVPHDDVEALADQIIDLLDNRMARMAIGEVNRSRAHALFSVEAMIDAYRALYGSLVWPSRLPATER